jgi:DNA-binding response OmpR family regulator
MARILVIDADERGRVSCCENLEQDGHVVVVVACAAAAREAIRRHRPDVVVLEVGPPSGNGLGIMEELLSLGRGIRIVLRTAHMLYEDDFRTWLADAYVRKSDDTTELRRAVRDVLQKSSPFVPATV